MVPFCPFWFGVPLLKPNSRKKGTLIVKGLLENLAESSKPLQETPAILVCDNGAFVGASMPTRRGLNRTARVHNERPKNGN